MPNYLRKAEIKACVVRRYKFLIPHYSASISRLGKDRALGCDNQLTFFAEFIAITYSFLSSVHILKHAKDRAVPN